MEMVNLSVCLRRVTKDDAQAALDAMEDILDEYDFPTKPGLNFGSTTRRLQVTC
jgi:hypothetical protein